MSLQQVFSTHIKSCKYCREYFASGSEGFRKRPSGSCNWGKATCSICKREHVRDICFAVRCDACVDAMLDQLVRSLGAEFMATGDGIKSIEVVRPR